MHEHTQMNTPTSGDLSNVGEAGWKMSLCGGHKLKGMCN